MGYHAAGSPYARRRASAVCCSRPGEPGRGAGQAPPVGAGRGRCSTSRTPYPPRPRSRPGRSWPGRRRSCGTGTPAWPCTCGSTPCPASGSPTTWPRPSCPGIAGVVVPKLESAEQVTTVADRPRRARPRRPHDRRRPGDRRGRGPGRGGPGRLPGPRRLLRGRGLRRRPGRRAHDRGHRGPLRPVPGGPRRPPHRDPGRRPGGHRPDRRGRTSGPTPPSAARSATGASSASTPPRWPGPTRPSPRRPTSSTGPAACSTAYDTAVAAGSAAIAFEGQMVDEPLARQARTLLDSATD